MIDPGTRPAGEEAGGSKDVVDLSVLVVSWNTRDLLRECVRSCFGHLAGLSAEVIVVDNASSDGSAAMMRREFGEDRRVRLVANPVNEGFARGNNQAFALSRGEFLAVVNPDIVFDAPALPAMVEHLKRHPGVGIVTCTLVGIDGARQSLHRAFPTLPQVFFSWTGIGRRLDRWLLGNLARRRYRLQDRRRSGVLAIDQAAAACLIIRRSTVAAIGGLFDERFPLFFNDVDLCRRVRKAGLEVHLLGEVSVIHHGSASLKQLPEGARRLQLYDALVRYYDVHEPRWRGRLVRLLVAASRRRVARDGGTRVDRPRDIC